MSKHKHKKHKPKKHGHVSGGSHGGMPDPAKLLADLNDCAERIRNADEATHIGPIWGEVHKLLLSIHADADAAVRIVTSRDVDGLSHLIATMRGDEPATEAADSDAPETTSEPVADIPPETLKKALRAFRKRLKLTKLDHESRLGRGAMTGGKKADFDAILPPYEFSKEVWQALTARGDLEDMGQGFYKLREPGTAGS